MYFKIKKFIIKLIVIKSKNRFLKIIWFFDILNLKILKMYFRIKKFIIKLIFIKSKIFFKNHMVCRISTTYSSTECIVIRNYCVICIHCVLLLYCIVLCIIAFVFMSTFCCLHVLNDLYCVLTSFI